MGVPAMTMKRFSALMVMAAIAMMAAQPASAGVGGCRIPGVGGCEPGGGWQLNAAGGPAERTPSVLDRLAGALPVDVIVMLELIFGETPGTIEQPQDDPTISGVGGCRILGSCACGVGGC